MGLGDGSAGLARSARHTAATMARSSVESNSKLASIGSCWARSLAHFCWTEKGSGTNSQMARRVLRTIGT
jgi:hypothetical protein